MIVAYTSTIFQKVTRREGRARLAALRLRATLRNRDSLRPPSLWLRWTTLRLLLDLPPPSSTVDLIVARSRVRVGFWEPTRRSAGGGRRCSRQWDISGRPAQTL